MNHQTGQFRPLCNPGFICLLLALATLAIYFPASKYGFLSYDDPGYFSGNPRVLTGLTWSNIHWAFISGEDANWHPLTWLSLMLDATLFGTGAAAPHLTNVLLHAANSILLFLLFLRLTEAIWRSAALAMLFAIHPLHVESVAWISERKDVLSAFFGLLALLCYVRYVQAQGKLSSLAAPKPGEGGSSSSRISPTKPSRHCDPIPTSPASGRPADLETCATSLAKDIPQSTISNPNWAYGLALFFFACGLLSKPMLVTLPCILFLLDYWPLRRFDIWTHRVEAERRRAIQRIIIEKVPFFLLAAALSAVTYVVQRNGSAVVPLSVIPFDARIGNALVSYARYIGKILWPTGLAAIYPYHGYWRGSIIYLSLVLFAGLCILAFDKRKKVPWLLTGWFWFAGMLVPVIGLVQVGEQAMADRYAYLPMVGVLVIIVWGVGELCRVYRPPRLILLALSVAVFIALAWRAQDQVRVWSNDGTLFGHTLAVTKDNYVAELDMGFWYTKTGNPKLALECYDAARKTAPDDPTALFNVGNAYARLGDWPEAIPNYQHALRLRPNEPEIMDNLGLALAQNKQLAEAIPYFEGAIKLDPNLADAQNNLGSALFMQGNYVEAAKAFYAAAQSGPSNPEFAVNLGDTLVRLGKKGAAAECYQQALQLEPDNQTVRNRLQALGPQPAQ